MKAIETRYNGYKFRSRLEARWAVFFNSLGIRYEYEYEGFELSNGTKYLPDFYLPTFDGGELWCEVKPEGGDFSKAKLFCRDYEQNIWFCEGTPKLAIYKIYEKAWWKEEETIEYAINCGIPNYSQAIGENRMYSQPCEYSDQCNSACDTDRLIILKEDLGYFNDSYADAVEASRSARFEFGENG